MTPTIAEIITACATTWQVTEIDILSARRTRSVARPRQAAMYLSRMLTRYSLPEIAAQFGKDHTTIMHGIRTTERLASENVEFNNGIAFAKSLCRASASNRPEPDLQKVEVGDVVSRLRGFAREATRLANELEGKARANGGEG